MRYCSFSHCSEPRFGFELEPGLLVDLKRSMESLIESGDLLPSAEKLLEAEHLGDWFRKGREALDTADLISRILNRRTEGDRPGVLQQKEVRLLAPLPRPSKIIAVGLNYREHALEQGKDVPERPMLFAKFPSAVIGPEEPIKLPPISRQVDPEAELCVVMLEGGFRIPRSKVPQVTAFMIGNDVSARDLQYADRQWVRGKSCDTFAPTGPFVVTHETVGDPHRLAIQLRVNGELRQSALTSDLIFDCYQLVEYISETATLEPGDIIFTGTPSGVGVFRDPPIFLQPGDIIEITIEKLGRLRTPVVAG